MLLGNTVQTYQSQVRVSGIEPVRFALKSFLINGKIQKILANVRPLQLYTFMYFYPNLNTECNRFYVKIHSDEKSSRPGSIEPSVISRSAIRYDRFHVPKYILNQHECIGIF